MDFTRRLALFEELKSLPWGAVWDYYSCAPGSAAGGDWFDAVRQYEARVLAAR